MDLAFIEKNLRPKYYNKQKNKRINYIGLSPQTYFKFLFHLDDDYLTDWEVMKFRIVFKRKMLESYIAPIVFFFVVYKCSPYFLRLYVDRLPVYRSFKICASVCVTTMTYSLFNCYYQFPNKQFHEIVTQPEPNGKYVRTCLKDQFPRNWSMMSKKLYDMGYNFKEMNEYSSKETMPDITNKWDNSLY